MKLYCGKNIRGIWKASENFEKIEKFDNIFECEIDKVYDDRVWMLTTYYGFDNTSKGVVVVERNEKKLYHSLNELKRSSKVWKFGKSDIKSRSSYHITDFKLATDKSGLPFEYGHISDGLYTLKAIAVKVI